MSDRIIIEVIIGIGEAQGTNDTVLRLTSDGIAVFFTDRERSATFGVRLILRYIGNQSNQIQVQEYYIIKGHKSLHRKRK